MDGARGGRQAPTTRSGSGSHGIGVAESPRIALNVGLSSPSRRRHRRGHSVGLVGRPWPARVGRARTSPDSRPTVGRRRRAGGPSVRAAVSGPCARSRPTAQASEARSPSDASPQCSGADPRAHIIARWRDWLEEAKVVDTAVYAAVAGTETPALDTAMRRLSGAADHSKLWFAHGGVDGRARRSTRPARRGPRPVLARHRLRLRQPRRQAADDAPPARARGARGARAPPRADAALQLVPLRPRRLRLRLRDRRRRGRSRRSRRRCGRWRRWSAIPASIPVSTIPQTCSSGPSSASAPPSSRPRLDARSADRAAALTQAADGAAADQRPDDRRAPSAGGRCSTRCQLEAARRRSSATVSRLQ